MGLIASPDYFYVNGVSSEEVGLYVDTPPVPPMAVQRVTKWSTGIDMDYSSPDDVWENITLTINAYVFFPESFDLGDVYAFLADARTLQLSRFSGRYLKVVQVSGITPQQQHDGNRIKLQIKFICRPFKYHILNEEYTLDSNEHILLENPGTRYSRPLYKINHSLGGETTLKVNNGEGLVISSDAANPIYIDCEKMLAYSENGHNETKYTSGQFPFLAPGVNTLWARSGIYNYEFTVIGNWRDY